jgi:hypothetical protein
MIIFRRDSTGSPKLHTVVFGVDAGYLLYSREQEPTDRGRSVQDGHPDDGPEASGRADPIRQSEHH